MDVPARFHDGRTALAHSVVVRSTMSGYEIRGEDGRVMAVWPHDDLSPGTLLPDGSCRLACRSAPDARLVLPPGWALAPDATSARKRLPPWAGLAAMLAAAVAMMAGMAASLPFIGRTVASWVPVAIERQWGDRMADNLTGPWRTCQGARGVAALARLTARLEGPLPADRRPRRVVVVDVPEANAFAMPGGTIVVLRGLVAAAEGPDEVAGVLAHEMTHVALRHPLEKTIRALGVSGLLALMTGDGSGVIAGATGMALAGSYSRADEAAADQGALDLLAAADISPEGLEHFFTRMSAEDTMPRWLADHPRATDRATRMAAIPPGDHVPALSAGQWEALRDICTQAADTPVNPR